MNPLNIHPLLIHFPIALLTIYSLLEIIPIKKIQQLPYLFYTKAIILIFGFTAILPTILTGLIIQQEFSNQQALVSLHSQFGELSAAIYGILTIIYIFSWI